MLSMKILKEKISKFYTKEVCYNLYEIYLKKWIAEGYIGEELSIFDLSMVDRKTQKDFFINLLFEIYSSKDKFLKIFENLPKNIKELLEYIIWETSYDIREEQRADYYEEQRMYYTNILKKEFQLFRIERHDLKDIIYLDEYICKILRTYMDKKPDGYYLVDASLKAKEEKLYENNNEKEFINNLYLYFEFVKSGAIRTSATGKLLKEGKKNMLKHCNITEYYGNLKGLEFLKTENICMFFELIDNEYKTDEYFKTSNLKNILKDFVETKNIKTNEHYIYSSLFLNHLKGVKNIWEKEENFKDVAKMLVSIIKEIKNCDMYISMDNIISAFLYRGQGQSALISFKDAKDYVYVNEATYERRRVFDTDDYNELILEPFIKSYFFLLGTLGLFELHYKKPEDSENMFLTNGYLTEYDGLRYAKLTELGKYIFGFKETYEIPTTYEKSEIFLEDNRLIVNIMGESPAKRMFFEKVSKKIGTNIYKITIDTFKKGIKSSDELIERITSFKNNIDGKEISDIWKEFFDDLLKKYNTIEEVYDYRVLKLTEEKELLEIMKRDKRFKDLCLKAENYFLLVNEKDIKALNKVFKEYGYYIDKFNLEKNTDD